MLDVIDVEIKVIFLENVIVQSSRWRNQGHDHQVELEQFPQEKEEGHSDEKTISRKPQNVRRGDPNCKEC